MKLKNRLHNHPKMEEQLGLDKEHVIIDSKLYGELLLIFSEFGEFVYTIETKPHSVPSPPRYNAKPAP